MIFNEMITTLTTAAAPAYPAIPDFVWILLIVSAVLCCMGFYKFVWFMSVGYGLSTAGIGATLAILSIVRGEASVLSLIQCGIMVIYGFRLGGFLLIRELKNEAYRKKLAEAGGEAKMPIFVMAFMWIFCAVLYLLQSSAAIYRLGNEATNGNDVCFIIGIVISALGVLLEALSDKQKSAQKKTNPNMPAMEGLFKMCRCPNYFGEILFWTGMFVSGIQIYQGTQWILAILGYILIVGIMLSGAKRLETRHIKHYGGKPEYEAYANKTPLIFPLIPLYHMVTPESIAKDEAKKAAKAAEKAAKKD